MAWQLAHGMAHSLLARDWNPGSGECLARPVDDTGGIQGAGNPIELPASGEKYHRRDAPNAKLARCRLLLLGVELQKPDMRLELLGGLLECWRHHAAGATPGGPEIHQQRDITALHLLQESGARDGLRLAGKKRLLAPAAVGMLRQPCRGYPVNPATGRTNDVQSI